LFGIRATAGMLRAAASGGMSGSHSALFPSSPVNFALPERQDRAYSHCGQQLCLIRDLAECVCGVSVRANEISRYEEKKACSIAT
jgi:hypothetical protein